ncbi:MAG: transglutaminase domain-containing protein [Planctomycetota bacterium]
MSSARRGLGFVVGFTALLPLAAQIPLDAQGASTPPESADPDFVAWIKLRPASEWYGMYVEGHKIGWRAVHTRLTPWRGETVYEVVTEKRMRTAAEGQTEETAWTDSRRYALHGDGPLLQMEVTQVHDGVETTRTVEREDGAYVIRSQTADSRTQRRIQLTRECLRQELEITEWFDRSVAGEPAPEVWKAYIVDLEEEEPEIEVQARYMGSDHRQIAGVQTLIHRVRTEMRGAPAELELVNWHRLVRLRGLVEIRREPESLARQLDADVPDVFAIAGIRVEGGFGEVTHPSRVVFDVFNTSAFTFPETSRQRVERIDAGHRRITLGPQDGAAATTPLGVADRARYLRGSVRYPIEADALCAVITELDWPSDADASTRATAVCDYVHDELRKAYGHNATDAAAVLARGGGDCTEHTLLFVALARAAGVPAREVSGLVPCSRKPLTLMYHAWAEYHDGGRWVEVDPTWGQAPPDATHLRLATEGDLAWYAVANEAAFKVVDVK